jgi:hypothetical protein
VTVATYDNEATARAVAFINAMEDDDLLAAARDNPWTPTSTGYQIILDRVGEDTNRLWITSRAATVAYDRGLIDETELDYITR